MMDILKKKYIQKDGQCKKNKYDGQIKKIKKNIDNC